jgi:hypothetical protein
VGLALFMGVASPRFTRYIEPTVDRLVIQLQQRTKPSGAPTRTDWAAAPSPTPADDRAPGAAASQGSRP